MGVAYLLTLIASLAPKSAIWYVEKLIVGFASPESALLYWYWYGGFVLYVGIPLVLLLRVRLLAPVLLVVFEQYGWFAFSPINQEFGTPLLVLFWPVPVAVSLLLGWIEYRVRVGLDLAVQPLVSE